MPGFLHFHLVVFPCCDNERTCTVGSTLILYFRALLNPNVEVFEREMFNVTEEEMLERGREMERRREGKRVSRREGEGGREGEREKERERERERQTDRQTEREEEALPKREEGKRDKGKPHNICSTFCGDLLLHSYYNDPVFIRV